MSRTEEVLKKDILLADSFSNAYNNLKDNFNGYSKEELKDLGKKYVDKFQDYIGDKASRAYKVIDDLKMENLKEGIGGIFLHGIPGEEEIILSDSNKEKPEGATTIGHEAYHAVKNFASGYWDKIKRGSKGILNSIRNGLGNYISDEAETQLGTLKVTAELAEEGYEEAEIALYKNLRDSFILKGLYEGYEDIIDAGASKEEARDYFYGMLDDFPEDEYNKLFDYFLEADERTLREYWIDPLEEIMSGGNSHSLNLATGEEESNSLHGYIEDVWKDSLYEEESELSTLGKRILEEA